MKWTALIAVTAAITVPLPAQSTRSLHDDTQQWTELQAYYPLTDQIRIAFAGGLRLGNQISMPVDERYGVGLQVQPNRFITFGGRFNKIRFRPAFLDWRGEERFSLDASLRYPFHNVVLTDRNLLEFRHRQVLNFITYRNRLRIDFPIKLAGKPVQLFGTAEAFYYSNLNRWPRLRMTAGWHKDFSRSFSGEFFYGHNWDGYTLPGNLHIIGVQFQVNLPRF